MKHELRRLGHTLIKLKSRGHIGGVFDCAGVTSSLSLALKLIKWARKMDCEVTAEDVLGVTPLPLDSADTLRFYAELNEMRLSHLE